MVRPARRVTRRARVGRWRCTSSRGDAVAAAETTASISHGSLAIGTGARTRVPSHPRTRHERRMPTGRRTRRALTASAAVLTDACLLRHARPTAVGDRARRPLDRRRQGWRRLDAPRAWPSTPRGSARIVLADDVGGIDDLLESKAIGDATRLGQDLVGRPREPRIGARGSPPDRARRPLPPTERRVLGGARHRRQPALRRGLARPRPVRPGPVAGRRGSLEPDPSECHVCSIVAETVRGRLLARQGRAGAGAALAVAWERATQTQDIQRLWPAVAGRVELAWLTDSLGTEVVADLTSRARHGGRPRHAARPR